MKDFIKAEATGSRIGDIVSIQARYKMVSKNILDLERVRSAAEKETLTYKGCERSCVYRHFSICLLPRHILAPSLVFMT